MEFKSDSPAQTLSWAVKIGDRLQGDELIFLIGVLGAGKTLFCKGLAEGMGIDPDEVVSPTFTLMNCFEGDTHTLHHLDLYRIGSQPGSIGFCPEIDDQLGYGVIVVEWAEYLASAYWSLEQLLVIELEVLDENTRRIRLSGPRCVLFT